MLDFHPDDTHPTIMNSSSKTRLARLAIALLGCLWIATAAVPGGAELFGSAAAAEAARPTTNQRLWVVREFSEIRIVPREPGSQPNQHPAQVNADVLRQQLGQVRFASGNGTLPLFKPDEAEELSEPLAQALANAGAADDVLLLSGARRSDATLYRPVAVTARLFVQTGALQFIVNDARFEFYDKMRGTNRAPEFNYGSRTRAGTAELQHAAATLVRADWLAIPLTAPTPAAAAAAPAAPAPAVVPATAPAPAAAAVAATTAAPVAPAAKPAAVAPAAAPAAPAVAAPAAAPPQRPRDAAFAEEIEHRLTTLKRLRDRGLISEEEYQQKRKEILALL